MTKGWKEIARLGGAAARYPHVLADAHGWCLRWGRNPRSDEKYYSSLPLLLHGLVEHTARRRLLAVGAALEIEELAVEIRDALASALGLCDEVLRRGGLEEHIRRLERPKATASGLGATDGDLIRGMAVPDVSSRNSSRRAV